MLLIGDAAGLALRAPAAARGGALAQEINSLLKGVVEIDGRMVWQDGREIGFQRLDVAHDYRELLDLLKAFEPDAIVHFAEQRAAPYSMKSSWHKRYTVDNNMNATHNVLAAIVDSELDTHVVHLGTMGVYGYGAAGIKIPEGYLRVKIEAEDGTDVEQEILYPANPGSIYHMTKTQDQLLFAFYNKNDGIRVTDLHQGIVWGTETEETRRDERLVNRFDYDGDYGTVLNRFLMQAAVDFPLTVHGTGGQTRAFIHIQDTVRCIQLALENPPERGDRVNVYNQMTETHRLRDLARLVSERTGAEIDYVPNPRNEADENELHVANDRFLHLGLTPITLSEGLMEEVTEREVASWTPERFVRDVLVDTLHAAAVVVGVAGVWLLYWGMDRLVSILPERAAAGVRPFAFAGPARPMSQPS